LVCAVLKLMYFYIQKLSSLLDKKDQSRLIWLVFFSVFISLIETIGISAIMPFIDIATNFSNIHSNQYYQWVFDFFGFSNEVNFAIVFGFFLLTFYIFRGWVNLLYSYSMAIFSQNLYALTTKKLFKTYLTMPYQVFTNKNSSSLTKVVITEASLMSGVVRSFLLMVSEIFVVIFLYALMLLASWKITLIFTAILIMKAIFLTKKVSSRMKIAGVIREKVQSEMYEIVNQLFGNFKHIKLQDRHRLAVSNGKFSTVADQYAKANTTRIFLDSVPKLLLETSGFSLVVVLLIFSLYSSQSNVSHIIPTLSLFILALYRLLPSINRIISGYNTFVYYHKSIDAVDEILRVSQEDLGDETIEFNQKIQLKNVSFAYDEKLIIENINLTVNKGEKIAFIGESGSGKSTLIDLIIGLYQPNQGEMKIDDVLVNESNLQNWRSQIGYISQQIYLFDGTIEENVCFGRKLDRSLLEKVLKQANIFDFLQTKQGVDALVGEGGIQLSGGQKQRIAIARALYGEPEILVLDEATSALDNETESKIMDEIYQISQDKTLFIIAHRLSTIKDCDKIYQLENGTLNVQNKVRPNFRTAT
jgi:ATP-binding cassette, subfamily B, bacterial PglK